MKLIFEDGFGGQYLPNLLKTSTQFEILLFSPLVDVSTLTNLYILILSFSLFHKGLSLGQKSGGACLEKFHQICLSVV